MLPIYLAMLDGDDEKSKFESLYLTYRKLMFHVANGILNDEGLAEDAVHHEKFTHIFFEESPPSQESADEYIIRRPTFIPEGFELVN